MSNGSLTTGTRSGQDFSHPTTLSVLDGIALLVGVVVGIGIFGFPPLVAQNSPNQVMYLALWLGGGVVMLIGALCYAELGSAYPDSGGEYAYLRRAWGNRLALLFAWARCSIIQTGAIAAVAFIFGDYAQVLLPLGSHGKAVYAALVVVLLTGLNILGSHQSKIVQRFLTGITVCALLIMACAALMIEPDSYRLASHPSSMHLTLSNWELGGALGMGMVFVLLTYGGWNEIAYISGELHDSGRNLLRVLLAGTLIIVLLYLLVNLAYLRLFGLEGLRQSVAVGADMSAMLAGPWAVIILSLLVCCTALGTINACIFTGGRIYVSLGKDLPALRALGQWNHSAGSPVSALLLQGAITLGLIVFGALSENGLQAMVAYTSPVFWLFMALTALALVRLRQRDPTRKRPFKVPAYPVLPVLFALVCLGLGWSSVLYAGAGTWLGLGILLLGVPLFYLRPRP